MILSAIPHQDWPSITGRHSAAPNQESYTDQLRGEGVAGNPSVKASTLSISADILFLC